MNNWILKRLDITEMAPRSQPLALKYFVLNSTQVAQSQIVSTFLILFLLDKITFSELGMLLAVQFGITALLDYPTGALGDAIGHKKILISAYLAYAVAVLFLLAGDSLLGLLPYVIFNAFGQSQESGALQSWFDNNYRITSMAEDNDRRIFGAFMGKMGVNFTLIRIAMYISAGIITGLFDRRILFTVQLGLILIALMLIQMLMDNEIGVEFPKISANDYLERLTGGVKFVTSSRGILFYFLGISLLIATMSSIWVNLMLFPFYQGYSGSDEFLALLRTIIILTGLVWGIIATRLSKRSEKPYRFLFLATLMINIAYFAGIHIYYSLVPPESAFVLIKYLGVIVIIQWVSFWGYLQNIFMGRLQIELIPDKIRNAVYSLQPTLVVIFSIPFVIIGGQVLSNHGFLAGCQLLLGINSFGIIIFGLGVYWLSKQKKAYTAQAMYETKESQINVLDQDPVITPSGNE